MSFSVVFISLLFIGSSIAIDDIDRLRSLRNLNSHISTYVIRLSKTYGGFQALQASAEYAVFQAQDHTIFNEEIKRSHNLTFAHAPNYQVQEVTPVDTVIANWRTIAGNVINHCINSARQFILDEQNEGRYVLINIWARIVNTTNVTWNTINQDGNIIDEHKGQNCPIYAKLVDVITTHTPPQAGN